MNKAVKNTPLFSGNDLIKLIIPLIIEQTLAVSIGLIDTIMVSSVGEAAVSGVSLVDSVNTLLIQILSALATGGAVVCSQYMGKNDKETVKRSAGQLVYVMTLCSAFLMLVVLFFNRLILRGIFGKIDADVMNYARIYFILSAISYPFLGLYNAGAALFRSIGDSKTSMISSLIMNILNIGGNYILIFIFNLSVTGAAIATLISRIISAVFIMFLIMNKDTMVRIDNIRYLKPDNYIIGKLLKIGIPSGLENGMFQIGKLAVSSLTSTFGTSAIAANSIASNVSSFSNIPGNAMGLAMVTVVGRCIGAGEREQAKKYSKKLLMFSYMGLWTTNFIMTVFAKNIVGIFNLTPEATHIAINLLHSFSLIAIFIWPLSFTLPNTLRAAGDAKFTMIVSIFSMWTFRVLSSYFLAGYLSMGVLGVWLGMYIDWAFRSALFLIRYCRGQWLDIKLV